MIGPVARVAVAAIGLAACRAAPGPAAARVPPMPGEGGPPWIELTSPHFTMWSDADPARARDMVLEMERLRQIVVAAVFPTAPANGRDFAVILRDDAELRSFVSTGEARAFAVQPQVPLWQPMIVLSASAANGMQETAVHELIHAISDGVIHHQPRWFGEGMAVYYETLGLDPKLGPIEIGSPRGGRRVRIAHLVPIAALFEWHGESPSEQENTQYITSWAWFWFLSNQHRAELRRYLQLLHAADVEGSPRGELARRIWEQAFPTLPLATADAQLKDWLFNGMHDELSVNVPAQEWSVSERPLADADVYAVRALLDAHADHKDRARNELGEALSADPTQVLARVLSLALDRSGITADLGRAIAAAHSDDWRAWLLLATATDGPRGKPGEAAAAMAKACALAAGNPAVQPPAKLCHERMRASSP